MTEIIGVRFKNGGKVYYFDPCGISVQSGQNVIIETSRGIEFGECATGNSQVEDREVVQPLRPLIRVATEEDCRTVEANRKKEARAFEICQQKILDHKLDMKLVEVEYNFEGNKILFFFTSDGRVDFRELVKDLASVFRMRIELRQIGVRDEAKMLGGLGICGQPFCCATFLDEFQPVSIKMAKTQNLSLNPAKISGTCGRLMCCLKYEQEAYEDLLRRLPRVDSLVGTPDGNGTVSAVGLLREQVRVRLDSAPDTPKCYSACDVCVLRQGAGKPRRENGQNECPGAAVSETAARDNKTQPANPPEPKSQQPDCPPCSVPGPESAPVSEQKPKTEPGQRTETNPQKDPASDSRPIQPRRQRRRRPKNRNGSGSKAEGQGGPPDGSGSAGQA
ncbi:PSP1 domain-containing protein [Papillibacter cinnamivorans]|uniref:Cell fate regulator YaaT, PSP1 superfamily (Controls sporulation, competence, biofilm development) n=1 Tax=Papillibacter cinnamivorans DSM 12816 TaxID=1122930 RepID=A0A1W2AAG6_9FIRM|nr:Cell fate regulator YaaT, PSP1 superfamily (controls sporulation, competence, biofilm development) [Papillibacter cinnamivorans DSM 12816]